MPYIKQEHREFYNANITTLANKVKAFEEETASNVAGHLNYIITKLILEVYKESLPNYSDYNTIIGILECSKLEMYRHQIGNYENEKIIENGDV